ncbi:MAG: hypothetical protein ACI4KR_02915 [Ruminiclostridium sp.]
MEFKRKTAGLIAAAALAAGMTTGAYATNVVDDIINGAEDIVDDTGDTAENILGGNDNNAANDRNDANNANNANNVDDVPGDRVNSAAENANRNDTNPVTGAGFFDAAITAVTAAGIAYITRRRNRMPK